MKKLRGGKGFKPIYVASCIISLLATVAMILTTFAPFWQTSGTSQFGLIGVVECPSSTNITEATDCTLTVYSKYPPGDSAAMRAVSPIAFVLGIIASIFGIVATVYWFLKAINLIVVNACLKITMPRSVKQFLYISSLLSIGAEIVVIILFFVVFPIFGYYNFCPWLAIASVPVMFVAWLIIMIRKRQQKKKRFCCC